MTISPIQNFQMRKTHSTINQIIVRRRGSWNSLHASQAAMPTKTGPPNANPIAKPYALAPDCGLIHLVSAASRKSWQANQIPHAGKIIFGARLRMGRADAARRRKAKPSDRNGGAQRQLPNPNYRRKERRGGGWL